MSPSIEINVDNLGHEISSAFVDYFREYFQEHFNPASLEGVDMLLQNACGIFNRDLEECRDVSEAVERLNDGGFKHLAKVITKEGHVPRYQVVAKREDTRYEEVHITVEATPLLDTAHIGRMDICLSK